MPLARLVGLDILQCRTVPVLPLGSHQSYLIHSILSSNSLLLIVLVLVLVSDSVNKRYMTRRGSKSLKEYFRAISWPLTALSIMRSM